MLLGPSVQAKRERALQNRVDNPEEANAYQREVERLFQQSCTKEHGILGKEEALNFLSLKAKLDTEPSLLDKANKWKLGDDKSVQPIQEVQIEEESEAYDGEKEFRAIASLNVANSN